jgi:hypothetical protein
MVCDELGRSIDKGRCGRGYVIHLQSFVMRRIELGELGTVLFSNRPLDDDP